MPRGDNTGLVRAQVKRLRAFAVQLERNLLQVEDDVGRVFNDAGDRLELVQHAFDADRGNGRALDGGEQRAAQGIADSGAEAALKGLRAELAVFFGERLGIDCKTLGLLKSSPKHVVFSFPHGKYVAKHSAAAVLFSCCVECEPLSRGYCVASRST